MSKINLSTKIVYLFGAGASYSALPIISDMKYRLNEFWLYVNSICKQEISKQFETVHEEIKNHKTPDTYAKILYLKNDPLLSYLKVYLSLYFAFEQLERGNFKNYFEKRGYGDKTILERLLTTVDYRYISFLSTVCEINEKKNLELPNNLSFVSWNYDAQFEIAYSRFSNRSKLFDIRSEIGMLNEMTTEGQMVRYVKLNGSADFIKKDTFDTVIEYCQDDLNRLGQITDFLKGRRSEPSNLHFAWENHNNRVNDGRTTAQKILKEADVVVVIGYSFPDFNRYIDKFIFANSNPEIIYVQDLNPEKIIEKLDGVKKGLRAIAQPIKEIDQFIIPYEFWE